MEVTERFAAPAEAILEATPAMLTESCSQESEATNNSR